MLRCEKINTVVVVTQAWHQPRATWSLEQAGLHALPWPVPRKSLDMDQVEDFLADPRALAESFYAMHELISLAYIGFR
jgi:uncharacterized SAM-binding protein YcdF (DUF218 family)